MAISGITTREFVIGDYAAACALWNAAAGIEVCEGDSRDEIAAYLERNRGLSCVAEENDALVGAVLCGHDGRRGLIYHLAVATNAQGRGIGQMLLEHCMHGWRAAGIKRALILVAPHNSLGRKFWLRNGWEDLTEAIPMARDI